MSRRDEKCTNGLYALRRLLAGKLAENPTTVSPKFDERIRDYPEILDLLETAGVGAATVGILL